MCSWVIRHEKSLQSLPPLFLTSCPFAMCPSPQVSALALVQRYGCRHGNSSCAKQLYGLILLRGDTGQKLVGDFISKARDNCTRDGAAVGEGETQRPRATLRTPVRPTWANHKVGTIASAAPALLSHVPL